MPKTMPGRTARRGFGTEQPMKNIKAVRAAAILVVLVAGAAPGHDGPKAKRKPNDHHLRGYQRRQYPVEPHGLPPALDRRDPSRPGGLDPTFYPPPT